MFAPPHFLNSLTIYDHNNIWLDNTENLDLNRWIFGGVWAELGLLRSPLGPECCVGRSVCVCVCVPKMTVKNTDDNRMSQVN